MSQKSPQSQTADLIWNILENHRNKINNWEYKFLSSICQLVNRSVNLSDRQAQVLNRIGRKILNCDIYNADHMQVLKYTWNMTYDELDQWGFCNSDRDT